MNKLSKTMWACVRKTEDREWISSICDLKEQTIAEHQKIDADIPHWAKVNPVIRIVQVKVIEV